MTFREDPPETKTCKFCGKTLEPEGLIIGNTVWIWRYPHCDCKSAEEYWKRTKAREEEQRRKEEEAREAKERRERIERLLGNSGMRERFRQRTFGNFDADTPGRKQAKAVAQLYVQEWEKNRKDGTGLYIEGSNGTGKTHIAAAVALELIDRGVPVIFKTGADILMDIRRSYDSTELREDALIRVYTDADLLVIDDLGKEQCTEWSMTTLFTIVNERYERMKPVIVTTNYSEEGLLEALAPRNGDRTKVEAMLSRLRETCIPLTMAWEDRRKWTTGFSRSGQDAVSDAGGSSQASRQ